MNLNTKYLPLLPGALGCLALLLRWMLYLVGMDEKQLLVPGHPLDLLVWAVTATAVLVCIPVAVRRKGSNKYELNFPPSISAAAGAVLMALAIALTVLPGWGSPMTRLDRLCHLCGLLAAAALLWVGFCRYTGKLPFFGCHAVVCLYLTLYTINHYQIWCSQPQLQNYVFSMAGAMLMALFGYHQTAFDADMGSRRMQLFSGLMAGFFCLAALARTGDPVLYLGGAVWALTNLCSLTPVIRRPNPMTDRSTEAPHETA